MVILIALFMASGVSIALLGTSYLLQKQTRSTHQPTWQFTSDALAKSIAGRQVDYTNRASSHHLDAYPMRLLVVSPVAQAAR